MTDSSEAYVCEYCDNSIQSKTDRDVCKDCATEDSDIYDKPFGEILAEAEPVDEPREHVLNSFNVVPIEELEALADEWIRQQTGRAEVDQAYENAGSRLYRLIGEYKRQDQ